MTQPSGSGPEEKYLSEVFDLLGDLQPQVRRILLQDLRSDIREAIDQKGGLDTEAVLAGFGTPEVTAHNLRLASAEAQTNPKKFPWLVTILVAIAVVVLLVLGFSATMTSFDSPGIAPTSTPAS